MRQAVLIRAIVARAAVPAACAWLFGALMATGCACERRIGIEGDTGLDEAGDPAGDTGGDSSTDMGADVDVGDSAHDTAVDPYFDPIYDGFGETGWRDSTVPLCRTPLSGEIHGRDVWSDPRGVFLLVDVGIADGTRNGVQRALFMNDGTGWSMAVDLFLEEPEYPLIAVDEITGVPGGPVLGWSGRALFTMDPLSGTTTRQEVGLDDLYVVDGALAYGILRDDPRLIVYDGVSWGPYPGDPVPYDVHRVWADNTLVFCAGYDGIVLSTDGSGWTVHATRTRDDFSANRGVSTDDVRAGTYEGTLHHWDGSDWTFVAWPSLAAGSDDCDNLDPQSIEGMWGKDGVLFFHTMKQIVMWDGAGFTVLASWPGIQTPLGGGSYWCADAMYINSIWGNSASELFIVVLGPEIPTEPGTCPEYLLWWDGNEFHWF